MPVDDPSDLNAENRKLKKQVERLMRGTGGSGGDSSHAGSGIYSLQIGEFAEASSNGTTALGAETRATDQYGTAVGYNSEASAISTAAFGSTSFATANYATALGAHSIADFENSTAVGAFAETTADDQVMLGTDGGIVFAPGRFGMQPYTPSGTADSQGTEGDITSDGSYFYVKTSAGWKRAALSTF